MSRYSFAFIILIIFELRFKYYESEFVVCNGFAATVPTAYLPLLQALPIVNYIEVGNFNILEYLVLLDFLRHQALIKF